MSKPQSSAPRAGQRVGLFVTCLVDLFRPAVGFATVKLLEEAGCTVDVPSVQTCCGQPAYNSGDFADAKAIARPVIAAFEPFDYVVVPSGSCGGMIKHHYPALFADDPEWAPRADALAAKTHELLGFLVDVLGHEPAPAAYQGTVTYHDSCSGRRELGVFDQPRKLLGRVAGLALHELPPDNAEVCCGFGGTFCVKYPEISDRMVADKCKAVEATGAGLLLAGDMGCLLNIAGKLTRLGSTVEVRHVAEVLAGCTGDAPPIGRPRA